MNIFANPNMSGMYLCFSEYEISIDKRLNRQHASEISRDIAMSIVALWFSLVTKLVHIIVIMREHISIGNSNRRFPQSSFMHLWFIVYLKTDTANNSSTENPKVYNRPSGILSMESHKRPSMFFSALWIVFILRPPAIGLLVQASLNVLSVCSSVINCVSRFEIQNPLHPQR